MYKGSFSNSFVKKAVIVFLFPIFVAGLLLRGLDYLFHKNRYKKEDK